MRVERIDLIAGGDPAAAAAGARALAPAQESVRAAVTAIVASVREGGDAALAAHTRELDTGGAEPPPLRVPTGDLATALRELPGDLRTGLELAAENVATVARAALHEDTDVTLPHGQRVLLRERPVRRAAIYVPGGRAPYPSSVIMGVVTAQAAGVGEVVVCSPPSAQGPPAAAILAACAICGVDEVYAMGGAQAIAALAYGTETVPRVDVIAGPGNLYVQEAKRLVAGDVGIDGFAGPSDLLVLLGPDADPHFAALDLLAQGEHGPETVVGAVSSSGDALDVLERELRELAPSHPGSTPAAFVLVSTPDDRGGARLRGGVRAGASSAHGPFRRDAGRLRAQRRLRARRGGIGHRVRRLRCRVEPRPADRRSGTLRLRAVGRRPSAAGWRTSRSVTPPPPWPPRPSQLRSPKASPLTPSPCAPGPSARSARMGTDEPHRADRSQDEGDRGPREPCARRRRRRRTRHRRRLPRPHARPARRGTPASTST